MGLSVRQAIENGYRTATGRNLGQGWGQNSGVVRSVAPPEQNRFQEPKQVKETPNLAALVRQTVGLRPRRDPAAFVIRHENTEMDQLTTQYHAGASALLNPKVAGKAGAQKQFDAAAYRILQLGNDLPVTGVLVKAGITRAAVKAGLQKRYGPVQRSAPVAKSDLKPSPVPQLDAWGMPRMTQGISPRAAVRRSMGLR